jgi:hypothetical protein
MLYVPTEPALGNVPSWPASSTSGDAQAFPYVSTFYDPEPPTSSSPEVKPRRSVVRPDFGYTDHGVEDTVDIASGSVYCGMGRYIEVPGYRGFHAGDSVFLNLFELETHRPQGEISSEVSGQVSILIYEITDQVIYDYRGRLVLPLYS